MGTTARVCDGFSEPGITVPNRLPRSVRQECLSKPILLGPNPSGRVLKECSPHHHTERNHQTKGNLLFGKKVSAAMARHTSSIDSEGFSSTVKASHDVLTLRAKAA